jgi:ferredoxin
MKVDIDASCTGCGLCVSAYPDVFAMGDSSVVVIVDDIPPELEIDIQHLAEDCPLEAIRID